ncbi:DUF4136 domain-containing protein [Edaphobacter sp. HDX4]
MRITKYLTLPLSLLLMLACAKGQEVHYNYDRGANFQSYRTYQWIIPQSGPPESDVPAGLPSFPVGPTSMRGSNVSDDQLLDQDIRRAVDAQLAEKGLTKVDKGGDLLVGFQAHVHEEKEHKSVELGNRWLGAEVHSGAASARFRARHPPSPLGRWLWACMTLQESS